MHLDETHLQSCYFSTNDNAVIIAVKTSDLGYNSLYLLYCVPYTDLLRQTVLFNVGPRYFIQRYTQTNMHTF